MLLAPCQGGCGQPGDRLREADPVTPRTPPDGADEPTRGGDPWAEQLAAAAGDASSDMASELARRAPASYRERTTPQEAALDAAELLGLARRGPAGDTEAAFDGHYRFVVRDGADGKMRIRRFADAPVELTTLLPVLESFGLVVEASMPYRIELPTGVSACIDDIGVHLRPPRTTAAVPFDVADGGPRLVAALEAAIRGRTDVDRLNGLVTSAGLHWREVMVLRAYTRYWSQCAPAIPADDLEEALGEFPAAAASLVAYFLARFDPRRKEPDAESAAQLACGEELAGVPLLRWDRALRVYLQLIDATVRTNYFRQDAEGRSPRTLAMKLESGAIDGLPSPRPRVETWVHGPQIEGVHLRAGMVARGGIRWSGRPADFRTEILDLMVAQVKKNAVIVPTGAKGGFVLRSPAPAGPDDVREGYATFVRCLLDITDNIAAGKVTAPTGVVTHDGPDPYLVVAADKGTAALSDLANEISAEYGFWLGDAFASGGSHGYNHKAMGITARGAWVAVRRHFHQLGVDVQREPVRVAGVGDMSGDVFGNGMLSSDAIHLVAAFDHRHIFLDPEPDPAVSYAERRRLAALPHSSWADYGADLISPGGGVWSRDAKLVLLTDPARRALGTDAESMTPPELITAILESPVDLLWFGGIGSFVKAAGETDSDVGDRANDEVRVTADRVRARVIGEGGNLGITQRARIRYSRRGGRINADFIDNAAGVATSDKEVNLKILLALALEEGRLDGAERDDYLLRAEPEVASEVLRQVDRSVSALNRAAPSSAEQLDAYAALIDLLEAHGRFDRAVEALPSIDELAVRRAAGAGLIRPELAVLLAYAKSDLVAALESAPLVADPAMADAVSAYFPSSLRDDYADLVPRHRLYDQILATAVAGEIVNRLGIVWAHETAAELGRALPEVASSFWAARQVTGAPALWAALDRRWEELPADAETRALDLAAEAVSDLARAYLRQGATLQPGPVIAADLAMADALRSAGSTAELDALVGAGLDASLAGTCVEIRARARVGEIGPVVRATGCDPAAARAVLDLVGEAAGTERMEAALRTPSADRWRAWLARAMRDDLLDWRHGAALDALSSPGVPSEQAARWVRQHEEELASARGLLDALGTPSADPVTVVAVALRRLPRARSGRGA